MTDLAKLPSAAIAQRLHRAGASTVLLTSFLGRYPKARTRRAYADALRRAALLLGAPDPVDLDWTKLEIDDLSQLRRGLVELYKPSVRRLTWTTVGVLLKQAWRLGMLEQDRLARLLDEPGPGGTRLPAGRALEKAEIRAVADLVAGPGSKAARAGAVFALGYGCGLREEEIVGVPSDALEGWALRVVGKGDKEREIPVPEEARPLLSRWLEIRGKEPGPLVCAFTTRGVPRPEKQLSPNAIWHVVDDICRAAGIPHASPHDFRRTFATELFDREIYPTVIQELMGHASLDTTRGYDKRPERGKAEAVGKLGFGRG